jgi:hypothetical protein
MTTTVVTLHFIRKGSANDETTDDVLKFINTRYHRMFRLTFSPGDGARRYDSYLTDTRAYDHVRSVLSSMKHDDVPFESVQVTTALQPSCMYHVSQLVDRDVIGGIMEAVWTALHEPVTSEVVRDVDPEEQEEQEEDDEEEEDVEEF